MGADLLILDDLRIDRETSFTLDEAYNMVNKRYLSRKPFICSTNLTFAELENPKNPAYGPICDRIIEMCGVRIKMTGASRRSKIAAKNSKIFQALLNAQDE